MHHAALDVLQREDVRSRQLSDTQKRELRDAKLALLKFWGVLSLVTLPWLLGAAGCVAVSSDMQWWVVAIVGFGPLVIRLATGAVGSALLAKRKRLLEAACTALPPLAPGEPARCHVCGGPLRNDPHEYVEMCGFCHADNIVAPAILARVQGRQAMVLHAHARVVSHEALALGDEETQTQEHRTEYSSATVQVFISAQRRAVYDAQYWSDRTAKLRGVVEQVLEPTRHGLGEPRRIGDLGPVAALAERRGGSAK